MTKTIKLTPTMKIIKEILTEYGAENNPREFELLEIYQIIRNKYELEICIHSLKNYLDTMTNEKIIRCLKKSDKYRLPTKVVKFVPTPRMASILEVLTYNIEEPIDFTEILQALKNDCEITEATLKEDLNILKSKNKITYLKKKDKYKLKNKSKNILVA